MMTGEDAGRGAAGPQGVVAASKPREERLGLAKESVDQAEAQASHNAVGAVIYAKIVALSYNVAQSQSGLIYQYVDKI